MKILQVYNEYRNRGGEDVIVTATVRLLIERGHQVRLWKVSSRELGARPLAKARAFFSGVYSLSAYRQMRRLLKDERPDLVHVHNLYPLLSPSILVACRARSVPVVLTLHNYGLTCPTWYHLYKGRTCERCLGGREYWCVFKNCRDNLFESVGYALRAAVARRFDLFTRNTTLFVALTAFAKQRLIGAGFPGDRIVVVPNGVPVPARAAEPSNGRYIAFAGRLSPEKGADVLVAAAGYSGLPVRIAGGGPARPGLVRDASPNVEFMGLLDPTGVGALYRAARFVVVPSRWFEGFPTVITEAMSYGLPVIASNIGGLPEMVEDGVTGLLFEPGNANDLVSKMRLLWENSDLCGKMGKAGRERVMREYSEDRYYERLMGVYARAVKICRRGTVQAAGGGPVASDEYEAKYTAERN